MRLPQRESQAAARPAGLRAGRGCTVAQLQVRLRSLPARTVAGISGRVERSDVAAWYDAAMAGLDEAVAGRPAPGPPGGPHASAPFTAGRGHLLARRPAA